MSEILNYLAEINTVSVVVRLIIAVICGGIVGLDRERKRRPAGMRTHILICVGAALVMMIGQYIAQIGLASDVSRLGAQVVSGIGFLGAGTIIVTGRMQVKGLTTAASLWVSACIGLAIGIGFYVGALVACLLTVIIITLLSRLDRKVRKSAKDRTYFVEFTKPSALGLTVGTLKKENVRIVDIQVIKDKNSVSGELAAILSLRLPSSKEHVDIDSHLTDIEGVSGFEEI
jgi:putative Mg2+ transporter-C (MgtC) family protein